MRITVKELHKLIKEVVESEADAASYALRSALNNPSTRLDRNLTSDMYAAAREEDGANRPSARRPPSSTAKASSELSDLNNPMLANLFSPSELQQLRQNIRSGGEMASTAADTIGTKISSAVEQLQNFATRFGLTESREEEEESGLTLSQVETLPDSDPRMQRFLRSPAAREYLRQNPDADIINPGPEKSDFIKFARDFDRGEEMEDRESWERVSPSAKRPGGLFGRLPREGERSQVSFGDDPLTADRKRREMNETIRKIVAKEVSKYRTGR